MLQRNTVQKEQVYAAVNALANHPTADEVYNKVREGFPAISRATVYRILNQMSDNGVLLRIRVPDGANHFDHNNAVHTHACCVKCGKVFDVELKEKLNAQSVVKENGEYKILGCNILFDALCAKCGQEAL